MAEWDLSDNNARWNAVRGRLLMGLHLMGVSFWGWCEGEWVTCLDLLRLLGATLSEFLIFDSLCLHVCKMICPSEYMHLNQSMSNGQWPMPTDCQFVYIVLKYQFLTRDLSIVSLVIYQPSYDISSYTNVNIELQFLVTNADIYGNSHSYSIVWKI